MSKEFNSNTGLTSEAQAYGLGHKLRSVLTPSGFRRMLGEKFSPEYKEKMEMLRDADGRMRHEAMSLKDFLDKAKVSFKENRFIDFTYWISQINQKVHTMISFTKDVVDLTEKELAQYYTRTKDVGPGEQAFQELKASYERGIVVNAGIADFFNRLLGTSFEKIYWKRIKERKLAVQSLLKEAEKLMAIILASLDRMGQARAQGDIVTWLIESDRIKVSHDKFNQYFKTIYNKHIADLVKLTQPLAEEKKPEEEKPVAIKTPKVDKTIPVQEEVKPETQGDSEPAVETLNKSPAEIHVDESELEKPSDVEPVESVETKPEIKTEVKPEIKRERGRPRSGDAQKRFDQLEMLLKKIKEEQTSGAEPIKETMEEPARSAEEFKKSEPEPADEVVTQEPEVTPEAKPVEPELETIKHIEPEIESEPEEEPKDVEKEEKGPVTFVLIPRGGIENMDIFQEKLEKILGHKVIFVTKESGRETVESYQDQGFDVDIKTYDDVKKYNTNKPSKEELISLLDNPKFMERLGREPYRNVRGDFHLPMILDLPEFEGIDKDTRQAIVNKLLETRKQEVESGKKIETSPKSSEPAFEDEEEPLDENLERIVNEMAELEDDEEARAIYLHSEQLVKLFDKPLKDLTQDDIWGVINKDFNKFWDILPKTKDGTVDLELVKKLPEYKIFDEDYQKAFLGVIRMYNSDIKKKRTASNKLFLNSLQKVIRAGDLNLAGLMLSKYSEEVDNDSELSQKLLKYAVELLND